VGDDRTATSASVRALREAAAALRDAARAVDDGRLQIEALLAARDLLGASVAHADARGAGALAGLATHADDDASPGAGSMHGLQDASRASSDASVLDAASVRNQLVDDASDAEGGDTAALADGRDWGVILGAVGQSEDSHVDAGLDAAGASVLKAVAASDEGKRLTLDFMLSDPAPALNTRCCASSPRRGALGVNQLVRGERDEHGHERDHGCSALSCGARVGLQSVLTGPRPCGSRGGG
jgi:hypothetical protein